MRLLLLLFVFLSLPIFSQNENSKNIITSTCSTTDKDGYTYVSGNFEGVIKLGRHTILSKGLDDIFIAKYSPEGKCVWATRDGGLGSDYVSDIGIDKKGNIYITGRFGNNSMFDIYTFQTKAENEFFVAKYNASGDLLFVNRSQGSEGSDNMATTIAVRESGECYIGCSFSQPSNMANEVLQGSFLLKFNSSLKYIGASKIGGEINSLAFDQKGSIYLTGYFKDQNKFCKTDLNSKGEVDAFLAKYNLSGECVWVKQLGGVGVDVGKSVTVNSENDPVIVGEFTDSIVLGNKKIISFGESDIFVAKYSQMGDFLWIKGGGSNSFDEANSVYFGNNGSVYLTGKIGADYAEFGETSFGGRYNNAFILQCNSKGNFVYGKIGLSNETSKGISVSGDGHQNVHIIGNFNKQITFEKKSLIAEGAGNSIFMIKLNAINEIITHSILGESDASFNFDPNANYVDVKGKLLIGKKQKKPLVNQIVSLFESTGEFLETTSTDVFGDFSFKNVNSKKNYSINLGETDSISKDEEIYLAKQTGEIISPIFRNREGKFKFELLEAEVFTLTQLSEEDPVESLQDFLKDTKEKEKVIKENIYYTENEYKLTEFEKKKVYNLVKILKTKRDVSIEISSYTDSRGDDNYNLELSKKRAKEVKNYFVSKGITEDRVLSEGYGETSILNRCENDVLDCSEKEHILNRRTEFKFVKK